MPFMVSTPQFQGPLDLLLQLIESEKMEISTVSLVQVTEPFVERVRENQGKIAPEDLADFLVVAAKLIYLKSKTLIPALQEQGLEEGPDLETQLRRYKAFVAAAGQIGEMAASGVRSYGRGKRPIPEAMQGFVAPEGVTPDILRATYAALAKRLVPLVEIPKIAMARAVTMEEKIQDLVARMRHTLKASFHRFLAESKDRHEMVVSFLALLELIKQRVVRVEQTDLFHDIQLHYEA